MSKQPPEKPLETQSPAPEPEMSLAQAEEMQEAAARQLRQAADQLARGDAKLEDLLRLAQSRQNVTAPALPGMPADAGQFDHDEPAVQTGATGPLDPPLSGFEQRLGITERWDGIDYTTSSGRCLQVLLSVLGWGGDARHLAQALPHFDQIADLTSLRAVLTRLNMTASMDKVRFSSLSGEKLPCLHEDDQGNISVLLEVNHAKGVIRRFNGATGEEETCTCDGQVQTVYLIKSLDLENQTKQVKNFGWVTHAASSFKKLFLSLFLINFGINMAALAVPIFIMAVYGYVIPAKAPVSLTMFVIGIGLVIAADYGLRALRSRIMSYIGARFDAALSVEVFQRLLYMPFTMIQSAPMGAQLARLRQFEKLREVFLGSLGSAILDLPFVLIFVAAIAIIGGWLAAIPLFLLLAYSAMALVTIPIAKRQTLLSGDAKSKKQNIMMELFLMHRDIRDVGGEKIWQQRFEEASAEFSALDFRAQHFSQKIQIISQALSMVAGLVTLGVGTLFVMQGDLGIGGLIAVMALIWRVLSPLQNAFLSLSRVGRLFEAVRMVNNLMKMAPERQPGVIPSISRKFQGYITIKNVSFRYPQAAEAAIKAANITIEPGELVAITGPSGGGKSTLLKLLAGLYRPMNGAIGFDHLDIRQIDLGELRFEASYQPDHGTFFYGTVEQNVQLNDPSATRADIERMMAHFNIREDHPDLPEGIDTRLRVDAVNQMSDSLKQKLMLSRTFAKKASYYFLDDPANYLDFDTDKRFMQQLQSLQGRSTILFTTQRPSHMRIADRILVMHEGQLILNGPPEQVLPQLELFNKSVA